MSPLVMGIVAATIYRTIDPAIVAEIVGMFSPRELKDAKEILCRMGWIQRAGNER